MADDHTNSGSTTSPATTALRGIRRRPRTRNHHTRATTTANPTTSGAAPPPEVIDGSGALASRSAMPSR